MPVRKTLSTPITVREVQNFWGKTIEDVLGKQKWAGLACLMTIKLRTPDFARKSEPVMAFLPVSALGDRE
jgi:hypothetical protein